MDLILSFIPRLGAWDSPDRSLTDDNEEGKYGLKELVPGVEPELDIIAIHGLNGHREGTWTAVNGVLWLRDLLPAAIPRARILTYGYDSRTHDTQEQTVSKQTLNGHGIKLLEALFLKREMTKTTRRPIIFVAHSLGGIVLKSALIHASLANPSHNDKHHAIKVSTYGIVFLGTPHQGANGVSLAKMAARIISVYEKTNDTVLRHLEQHPEWLSDQLEQYKAISNDFDTKFCFEIYETPVIAGRSILVVPAWSASVPGATNVDVIEIRKNHRNMVRFKSAQDDDFTTIAGYLSIMADKSVTKIARDWSSLSAPAPPTQKAISRKPSQDTFQSLFTDEEGFRLHVNIPYASDVSFFVGRDDPLEALDRILTRSSSRSIAVLHGSPGIGKTQVAVHFCHTRRSSFSSVFWINASSRDSTEASFLQVAELVIAHYARLLSARPPPYARISEKLGLKGMVDESGRVRSDKTALEGVKNAVMAWFNLESNTKWLLVYDNYDDPEHFKLERFIPSGSHGKIIVTSRMRGCARLGQGVLLNLLDRSEAVELLLHSCQRFDEPSGEDEEFANQIVHELGYLPLAVDHAGAYIFSQCLSLKEYPAAFNNNVKRVLSKQSRTYGFQDRHDPVFKTFETSFVKIENFDPVAAEILVLCSFYDNSDVPSEIFSSLANDPVEDHLETLYSFSLVKRADNGYIAIHPLVRVCARERLRMNEKRRHAKDAFETIVRATRVENEHDYSNDQWSLGRKSIPHLTRCSKWIVELFPQSHEGLRECTLLWKDCALLHQAHGLYSEAEMFYERALESQVATLGNESLETMRTKLGLAKLYRLVDRNDEAEKLYDDCLRVFTRERGSNALETTQAPAGFGNVRWRQSQLPETKSLLERSIRGYKARLGSAHPETLVATEALGLVYKDLGDYGEATKLIREALDHNTKNFGPEHPGTVRNTQSLALCLIKLDRLDEAAQLQQRVVETGERQLGSLHPTILRALHNMAYINFLQGKHDDAQPLCELAITGREKILGKDSLETYGSVELLGVIYFRRGKLEDAQNILRRAIKGLRSQSSGMGGGVLSLFRALDWLAQVCEARGDVEQAKLCYEEALEGHFRALGPKHSTTKKNMQSLQELLSRVGEVGAAEEVGRRFGDV